MEDFRILTINPGSTSTKFAVFSGTDPIFIKTIRHTTEELEPYEKIADQFHFRKELILEQLQNADIELTQIRAVVGRGGLLKPIESGVYEVNDTMLKDLKNSPLGEHASNLGGLIAHDIAASLPDARAFIANPVVVDELDDIARLSGHPLLQRVSIFHALNQKAVARQHAKSIMRKYEEMNLIVVHLGGGITVGAHKHGRVVDVNQGLDGDGPFSPERTGTLPVAALARLCFSGKYSLKQVLKMIKGEGGLVAYLGTNSAYEVEQRVQAGDKEAELVYKSMAYQVAKEIGSMATVMHMHVDGILITGGIAHDRYFVNLIIERVHRIAPVHVYPGEDELKALAMNGLRVLSGEAEPKVYN
ncbi:MAG: butyrate kinase [Bacteroidetes bacterium]|nr:butyrate kinase [Bacteroidota bacterium]MBU1579534.1 butyrate kinase [Bacteroidota bacterium]MBU2465565.1 butyrate kinase [Bacteroidota bacterium]MBU2557102.1 butyrate kinase [Bacteroidota bacterium]